MSTITRFVLLAVLFYAAHGISLNSTSVRQERGTDARDEANGIAMARLGGGVYYFNSNPPRTRVFAATAVTNKAMVQAATNRMLGSNPDSKNMWPRGWQQISGPFNRCHLIGRQFGGSGDDGRNLFACPRYANSPVMSYYENKLAQYLKRMPTTVTMNGENRKLQVRHTVRLTYDTSRRQYPTQIYMLSEEERVGRKEKWVLTLQELWITNEPLGSIRVTIRCGTFNAAGSSGPPSLPNARISRISSSSCGARVIRV